MAGAIFLFALGRGLGTPHVPEVEITPLEVDLGDVQINQQIGSSFTLRNIGGAPLLIKEMKTSCQCTIPVIPSKSLAPGASEEIKVLFTASSAGSKLQRVVVETNDPSRETAVFTLRASAAQRIPDVPRTKSTAVADN